MSPSTSTASTRRSTSGATRSGRATAATTSTPTASSSAPRRSSSASSATSSPAPRSARGDDAGGARLRLRRRLGPLHRRASAVDHPGWDVWEGSGDPDEVWRRYFESLAECARSGLFDILAHPDLVKVWGGARPLPERDLRFFYEPAVAAIAESGIAVEISTAGLRKPVGELYPARGFAEMCVEAGASFALSSDAHLPEQVGFAYERAVDFLDSLGVGEICVFDAAPAPVWLRFPAASADGRDRLRQPPLRGGPAPGPGWGRDRPPAAASLATPTPTFSPTR